MMLMALMFTMLGTTVAMGQKIYQAELDKSMFKAWTSNEPGATEDLDPAAEPKAGNPFACEFNLYKEVGAYGTIFGSANVYCLWYADITGTQTMTVTGTPGMNIRVMLNRVPFVEGGAGDADGGAYVELIQALDENGQTVFDLSSYEYLHLNAIKVPGSGPGGVVKSIVLKGTVKPVTGILSVINNGDAEGTDLESFPVSYDGPNNGSTANERPEIVEGAGVNGSRCFKVTSFDAPTETWHTQFYVKSDEVMAKGSKWILKMSVKADRPCTVTTSAQAAPRTWKGGMGIEEFGVTQEWQDLSWTGEIGVDEFQSIAFDLNNENGAAGNASNIFYFDNIEFGYDLGGSNPMSDIALSYGSDVICVNIAGLTNMKDLVKAAGGKTLIYDNSSASVTWNGKNCNVLSVEGRPDGNLYIFLLDMDGEGGTDFDAEDAEVKVGFKNPEDAAFQLKFTSGKWEGEPMPEFSGMVCDFDYDLGAGDIYSYLWGAPDLESAEPENGSFNLPVGLSEFKITFNQLVETKSIVAKLGKESLTVANTEEMAKTVTLVRASNTALNGEYELVISKATGEKGMDLEDEIVLNYSFGKVEIDPNDKPEDILGLTDWNETADGGVPAGYEIWYQTEEEPRVAGNTYGSGARMFAFGDGGDFTRGLYFREGYVYYGTRDDYKLELKAGKKYNIHFNSAKWKSNADALTFQIFSEDDMETALYEETINPDPDVNGSKNAVSGSTVTELSFVPEADGNYILKWAVDGYKEVLIANPTVKYVPSMMGVEEMTLLETALENAKATRDGNSDERYDGAAFDALAAAITKYEAEKDGYTAPSVYQAAAADLDALAQALKDHRSNCDAYDPLPESVASVVDQYADSKFAVTDIYKNLVVLLDKYATKTTTTETDPDTGEEITVTTVAARVIKDDAELQAAVDELKKALALAVGNGDVARSGKGMFTVGEPQMGDWSATCTGVAVLVDRIRHGAEALISLGVDQNDADIVAANNALTDDDALAEALKARVKKEVYGQQKDNKLFEAVVDEETLEETTASYDMTVFVKNPSIYCLNAPAGYKGENIPGWDVVDFRGFSTGWGDLGTAEIPVGVMFSNWGGSFTVSQTVTDLPAGVYRLTAGYGERYGESDITWDMEESYFYAKTSDMTEDSLTVSAPSVGQAFPVDNCELTDVVVTDGKLTLGVQASQDSHVFFNEVKLYLTGAATGFDYAAAYTQIENDINTGVEAVKPASVRGIALYDLNGRRIGEAQKGIQIVKKYMSDGTIRVEKVVKK